MAEGEDVGGAGVRAARRARRRRVHRTRTAALGAVALVAVTAWVQLRSDPATTPVRGSTPVSSTTTAAGSAIPGAGSPADAPQAAQTTGTGTATADAGLPLRERTLAKISPRTRQVVVVEGRSATSSVATVRYFERDTTWTQVASWTGHVGRAGWTSKHREGDLKTPTGVYTLSDAGGRLPDPGTRLTYDRSPGLFRAPASGPGFGDSAADTFDYVIAIDYNRVRGRSPLDYSRPLGAAKGGGIWMHVDHDGPTHGCVSLPKSAMRLLLERLSPEHRPVVVMGPASSI